MKRVALVTGGSKGLGLKICLSLLDQGYTVYTFARQKIQHPPLDNLYFTCLDITDKESVSEYIDKIIEIEGKINILINNAAIGQDQLLLHLGDDTLSQIIDVNLTSLISLTKKVLKPMFLQDGGGKIINITSICANKGYAGLSAYAATKAGVEGFTRCLVHEIGPKPVFINSIAPGFFESEMSSVLSNDQLTIIKNRTPTRTLSTFDHIIKTVIFLLNDNLNMTGQIFKIDGGSSI